MTAMRVLLFFFHYFHINLRARERVTRARARAPSSSLKRIKLRIPRMKEGNFCFRGMLKQTRADIGLPNTIRLLGKDKSIFISILTKLLTASGAHANFRGNRHNDAKVKPAV